MVRRLTESFVSKINDTQKNIRLNLVHIHLVGERIEIFFTYLVELWIMAEQNICLHYP